MPTLNLSVSDGYAVQNTLPLDVPITLQNVGSNTVEMYIGASAPTNQSGIFIEEGEVSVVTITTGELLYTKTRESGRLSHLVGVH